MIEQEMGDKDITLAAIDRLTKLKGELLKTAKVLYERKESAQTLDEKEGEEGGAGSEPASNSASCTTSLAEAYRDLGETIIGRSKFFKE